MFSQNNFNLKLSSKNEKMSKNHQEIFENRNF